jgi:murein DD-endopeptidase MepM/ murein hydrolase activator NlpD
MKNSSKIILTFPLLLLAACENDFSLTQPAAKVEYHLEDYYGYGDVQGPYTADSSRAKEVAARGEKVIIEDHSAEDSYSAPADIEQEDLTPQATQVYTVSDKVGPAQGRIIRDDVETEAQTVDVSGKTHVVAKGETLFSLSRQYDIPILPIIVANDLEPPYSLKAGQQVRIPEGKFHVVKEGETLYSISRDYGVDMSGIVKLNDMSQPYNVSKGQKLQIPFPTDLPSEEIDGSSEALAETTIEEEQPVYAGAATDDEGKPASLRRPSGGVLGELRQDINGKTYAANAPQPVILKSQNSKIDTEVENKKLAAQTKDTMQQVDIKNDGGFMWPVKGNILKKFGQQGGEYNDGINIASAAGAGVKASSGGRVVYTGNSLKSYGNLVIIKHDNGLLSAYAHLNNVNVKKDQKVSKGQTIGTVGSTGKVTSPQLYFAIRNGKDAKNPMNYLK